MQHLDDLLDHLSRLRGHLEPCVEGVYGLVTETLGRKGGKVSIWFENNLIITGQLQLEVEGKYRLRGINVGEMSNPHCRPSRLDSN